MKVRSLLFSTLCVLAMSAALTACSSDNDQDDWSNDEGSKVELPANRAFILNQGKNGGNNAGLAFYAPDKNAANSKDNFITNIYKLQNGQELGDVGQDIIKYNGHIYITMYGSKLLIKLNEAGVEQQRISFTETDGAPRYMAVDNGKIYVTLYSGKVARIDANTLAIEDYVAVGKNPEEIIEEGNKLYVANSGWGSGTTVSVIDMATFKKEKDIEVTVNPNLLLEANDEIYLISFGNWGDIPQTFQRVITDPKTGEKGYEVIADASLFAERNDLIYLIDSKTNWTTKETINTFFTYNAKNHTLNKKTFLQNMPEELGRKSLMGISIDDENGDIYVTTSDFTSNGDAYRFSANGTFIEKFDCGGINPVKMIFLNNK